VITGYLRTVKQISNVSSRTFVILNRVVQRFIDDHLLIAYLHDHGKGWTIVVTTVHC